MPILLTQNRKITYKLYLMISDLKPADCNTNTSKIYYIGKLVEGEKKHSDWFPE